jgi:preprotein translocase subunit SecE
VVSKTIGRGFDPYRPCNNLITLKVAGVRTYIVDTITEMTQNVTWPTWKELQSNTLLVIVAVSIFSIIVKLIDLVTGISNGSAWKGLLGTIYHLFD